MIVGLGCDIVRIARVKILLQRIGERFISRLFVGEELSRVRGMSSERSAEFLAARVAAKEAAVKALGVGFARGISWKDVEVCSHRESGAPFLVFCGKAQEYFARCATHVHVSLSHEKEHAMAVVVLEKREG